MHPALPIVLCTGKPYCSTKFLRDALDLYAFHACHLNGNVLYAPGGAVLAEYTLKPEVVGEVYAALCARRVSVFLYERERVYQVLDVEGGMWARRMRQYGTEVEECLGERADEVLERVRRGEIGVVKIEVCEDEATLPGACI